MIVDTAGLSCSEVDTSTPVAPGLPAGSHALVPPSCTGATLSGPNAANYAVAYTGSPADFTVTPAPLTITASNGTMTYGGVGAERHRGVLGLRQR